MEANIVLIPMPGVTQNETINWPAKASEYCDFWNNEIDDNLDGVLTVINEALHEPPTRSRSARPPSPFGGGIELDAARKRSITTPDKSPKRS
jgi:hypothetical protein